MLILAQQKIRNQVKISSEKQSFSINQNLDFVHVFENLRRSRIRDFTSSKL